jgi:ribosomal protein S18 acetylase RimI-like enzyme
MSEPIRQRRFPWWVYWTSLVFIGLFAVWPIASLVSASMIAQSNGCLIDEGSVHPCMISGEDWGENLYTMAVLGWLMLATVPLGLGAGIVWLIVLLIHHAAWARQAKAAR